MATDALLLKHQAISIHENIHCIEWDSYKNIIHVLFKKKKKKNEAHWIWWSQISFLSQKKVHVYTTILFIFHTITKMSSRWAAQIRHAHGLLTMMVTESSQEARHDGFSSGLYYKEEEFKTRAHRLRAILWLWPRPRLDIKTSSARLLTSVCILPQRVIAARKHTLANSMAYLRSAIIWHSSK